jgi:hypothetical protein
VKAETENALGAEFSLEATISRATAHGGEAGRVGATTTAGRGARAAQQFAFAVFSGAVAGAQQLCAVLWVRCRQVPSGASIVPINRMATAARWKTPFNMVPAYHKIQFLR